MNIHIIVFVNIHSSVREVKHDKRSYGYNSVEIFTFLVNNANEFNLEH